MGWDGIATRARIALEWARGATNRARRDLEHRRLGARGAWVVAISGLAGLAVGAVSSTVYASGLSGDTSAAGGSIDAAGTIPPIIAAAVRTSTTFETVSTPIEPESITQTDPNLPLGSTKILSKGDPGEQVATYSVTLVGGIEVSRELVAAVVVKEPTHDVVSVGSLAVPERPAIVPGSNRDIGMQIAAARGWTGIEWQCLDNLFERESNWRHLVGNPSSGAYGIPQALPGSKMASAGSDWKTNPATQITWGLGYVEGRYGTPCGAWAAWTYRSPHWY